MTSPVIKRSIVIDGTKTSISIENAFWESLKEVAAEKGMTISALVSSIKANRRENSNLSSAIRVYLLSEFRTRLDLLLQGREAKARPGDRPGGSGEGPALTRPATGR